jgi:uncharacterized protein (TIGR02145 family)
MRKNFNLLTLAIVVAFVGLTATMATGTDLCGDANADDMVDISDVVYLIAYIFSGGLAPHCPPTLTTAEISLITQTTAQSGGTITSDGGLPVTTRGVCWSTNPTPTVANNITTDGAGTGNFTSSITGLTANTPYYVRAYATNSVGTDYGNAMSFTTVDDYIYQTVTIGTQVWMAENLRVTRYRNGDAIPNVTVSGTWAGLTTGAYCEQNNDVSWVATYGRLYNWYAVSDNRNIAPEGWHVASDAEWMTMYNYLGGAGIASTKLREAGDTHWGGGNDATNESGFTALPGGYRSEGGYYDGIDISTGTGCHAMFWYSTEVDSVWAGSSYLHCQYGHVFIDNRHKGYGLSVRCVKD